MSFGTVAFAEQSFSTMQQQVLAVAITGSALSMNAGSSTTTAHANVSITGTALAFSINGITITADANISPTAAGLTSSIGVANGIAWEAVSTGTAQTWTAVSTGTAQTWKDVDEVEKVA
tara:strand:- start:664 stop:1020 length:357 start_codon:yes stop_codon:yes gene_type:complete